MKLYENIVIGNFLYSLGFAVRALTREETVPSVVNLLQQTPADKELADVLLEFPGVVRLIEFKQRNNDSMKEKTRHSQLSLAIGKNEHTIAISRSIHWFVETNPENQTLVSRIVPYIDAYPRDNQYHSLAEFVSSIASDVVDGQSSFLPEELRDYLSLVSRCQGSGTISSGGLLLAINSKGDIRFVALADMMLLRLQHREFVNTIKTQMEKPLARKKKAEKSREHEGMEYESQRY